MGDSNPVEELYERLVNPIYYIREGDEYAAKMEIPTDPQHALKVLARAVLDLQNS